VVTHKPPKKDAFVGSPFAFITEGIGRAVERAVEAAGGRMVHVAGGATIAQQALRPASSAKSRFTSRRSPWGVHLFDGAAPKGALQLEQTA
jgi:dihydrofolate reductase